MTAGAHGAPGKAARDARGAGGGDEPLGAAPGLLGRPAEPTPLPPPVREVEEVTSLHERWANLTGVEGDETSPTAPGAAGGGVRAKVRARMASAAAVASSQERAQDRELIGALIRAVDTLAGRIDEVAARLGDLELLVQELADRTSEDLVRVHLVASGAAGGASARATRPGPSAAGAEG